MTAVHDHPFANDINDLVNVLLCDVPREGVTAFLV